MEERKKFYTLSNDLVFKNVFLKDEKMAKWLLEGTMRIVDKNFKIDNLSIKNCELAKDRLYIRNKTIDALLDCEPAYFNLELNNSFYRSTKIRNFFFQISYLANLVHVAEEYEIDKPVVQINYNNKKQEDNDLLKSVSLLDHVSYEEYLDIFYIINFDIAKILDKWYNELNQDPSYFEKYKYVMILGMDEQEFLNLEVDDDMINKIRNKVIDLNKSPKFYQVLTDEEDERYLRNALNKELKEIGRAAGIEEGRAAGIEEGKVAGIEQTKIENARRMKSEKLPFDLIGRVTGLDLSTIVSL